LCKIIAMPCTVRSACQATGTGEATFFEWLSRGEKGEQPFAEFAEAVTRARGQGKVKVQRNIWDSNDPRVKLELLARIYSDEFGRVEVREIPVVQDEKRINVAFILNMPDGSQRQTSFEEAQKMFATFPIENTCVPPVEEGKLFPGPKPDSDANPDELGNDVDGEDSPC
jgi:hypothetical protein